jgi:hypothetical protein
MIPSLRLDKLFIVTTVFNFIAGRYLQHADILIKDLYFARLRFRTSPTPVHDSVMSETKHQIEGENTGTERERSH